MSQKTAETLNKDISDLRKEITILRSFAIGFLGKDQEGEYRPEFVKKVLKSVYTDEIFVFK